MKVLVVLAVAFAIAGASILPKLPNNKRYQYTQIIIDNIDDNENSLTPKLTTTESALMSLENCVNGSCDFACKRLGWHHGQCVSANTCHCYN